MATAQDTRRTDKKGRVALPPGFADATVIIERVSDTEVRIRKARVIAEDEMFAPEGALKPLSDRDRDTFLSALDRPPAPAPALRKAATRHKARHG
jgi:hypothetical protein